MKAVKRVEIVIGAREVEPLLERLAVVGVADYTLVRGVAGQGGRGTRRDDELTNAFTNVYLIVACDAAVVRDVVDAVRPALARYGGMCLVSDALWVLH